MVYEEERRKEIEKIAVLLLDRLNKLKIKDDQLTISLSSLLNKGPSLEIEEIEAIVNLLSSRANKLKIKDKDILRLLGAMSMYVEAIKNNFPEPGPYILKDTRKLRRMQ